MRVRLELFLEVEAVTEGVAVEGGYPDELAKEACESLQFSNGAQAMTVTSPEFGDCTVTIVNEP